MPRKRYSPEQIINSLREAEVLLSACVFCKNNLFLAATESNSDLPVMDITQLLEDCEITGL